jgi:hypothetical protein
MRMNRSKKFNGLVACQEMQLRSDTDSASQGIRLA